MCSYLQPIGLQDDSLNFDYEDYVPLDVIFKKFVNVKDLDIFQDMSYKSQDLGSTNLSCELRIAS